MASKSQFVNLLCEIWRQGLSESNIKSGFSPTGVYPVDSSKYKLSRLNPQLLKKFEAWVEAGKPEGLRDDLANGIGDRPKKTQKRTP